MVCVMSEPLAIRQVLLLAADFITYKSKYNGTSTVQQVANIDATYQSNKACICSEELLPDIEYCETENDQQAQKDKEQAVLEGELPLWLYCVNKTLGVMADSVPFEIKEEIISHCHDMMLRQVTRNSAVRQFILSTLADVEDHNLSLSSEKITEVREKCRANLVALRNSFFYTQLSRSAKEILRKHASFSANIYRRVQQAISTHRRSYLYKDPVMQQNWWYGTPGMANPTYVRQIKNLKKYRLDHDSPFLAELMKGEADLDMQSKILFQILDSFHEIFKKEYPGDHVFAIRDFVFWLCDEYALIVRQDSDTQSKGSDDDEDRSIMDNVRGKMRNPELWTLLLAKVENDVQTLTESCRYDDLCIFILRLNGLTTHEIGAVMNMRFHQVHSRYDKLPMPGKNDGLDVYTEAFLESFPLPRLEKLLASTPEILELVKVARLTTNIRATISRYRGTMLYRNGTLEGSFWYGYPGLANNAVPTLVPPNLLSAINLSVALPCLDTLWTEFGLEPAALFLLLDSFLEELLKRLGSINGFYLSDFARWMILIYQ